MKKTIIYSIIVVLSLTKINAQRKMDERMKPSQEELQKFLSNIPQGEEKDFGFTDRKQFKKASLGSPILMQTFNEKGEIITENGYRIPIIVNTEKVLFLTARLTDGNLEIVDMGGSVLAHEIGKYESSGIKVYSIMRLYNANIDFVQINDTENEKEAKYYPLSSATQRLTDNKSSKQYYSADDLRNIYKNTPKNNN
ncbi:hypothetical protein ACQWU4_02120 [Chryseobacterium sp. MIQD13]|uniref:hypothetical protein n=1 Tax=Chryseobacterium sp. MIQD13 TaxID=3422310 RepID=UPI003D281301